MPLKSQLNDKKMRQKNNSNSNILKAFENLKNTVHTIMPGHMYSCQFMGSLADTNSCGTKKKIFYEEKSV